MTKIIKGVRTIIRAVKSPNQGELMETGEINVISTKIFIIRPVCGNCGSDHTHMRCHGCNEVVCADCWCADYGLCGDCVNPAL